MKVLITGAAGFIGGNLVHYLSEVRPSWQLVALDALTYAGNFANIKELCDAGKVSFTQTDIRDQKKVNEL